MNKNLFGFFFFEDKKIPKYPHGKLVNFKKW